MATKILLVDDEEIARAVLAELCGEIGLVATQAASAEEALSLLKGEKPDLIITDLRMPGMGGEAFVRTLKKTPSLDAIPVLVISSHAEMETVVRCLYHGAEDVLEKPFCAPILKARILSSLERATLRRLSEGARRQEDRDQTVKQMVGAVCHHFNQPLTVLQANLQMLQKGFEMLADHDAAVFASDAEDMATLFAERSAAFFASRNRRMTRADVVSLIQETADGIATATRRIGDLVRQVDQVARPVTESYTDTSRIVDFAASSRQTVLLAVGDLAARIAVSNELMAAGHHVLLAENGHEAEHHARYSSPHLFVTDFAVPSPEAIAEIFRLHGMEELRMPILVYAHPASVDVPDLPTGWIEQVSCLVEPADGSSLPGLVEGVQSTLCAPSGK